MIKTSTTMIAPKRFDFQILYLSSQSSSLATLRAMETKFSLLLVSFFFFTIVVAAAAAATTTSTTVNFLSCLASTNVRNFTTLSSSTQHSSSYYSLLNSSIRNFRFADATVAKPAVIVLPGTRNEVRNSVLCCRDSSMAIRIRSGGHSYEGLSYTGDQNRPFVVIDLMNLNRVRVNSASSTAWVESGATLGEIYHSVATESGGSLGFPAGSCPTVGSGGHIAGGGFGLLSRKFGLAADNVLDAILIDSTGRVLDRLSMGEDVFWAIRGGGGGSWGVIYAWKIRLVPVPNRITIFSLNRQGSSPSLAQLIYKWQHVAPSLPDEFYLSTVISAGDNGTISASFNGQFLGLSQQAISALTQRFPELGLTESDCKETSWIESVVHYAGLSSTEDLKVRKSQRKLYFKAKSDYVRSPIPVNGLIGAFNLLTYEPRAYIIFDPYGGAMGRVKSRETPFPHRRGNLFDIQYMVDWMEEDDGGREGYIAFLRRLYEYMTPFVSKNPRAAYVNYVDLDLGPVVGANGTGGPQDAVSGARVWGEKYFLGNFDRLVQAKTAIDPYNVFSSAQSIPPLSKH